MDNSIIKITEDIYAGIARRILNKKHKLHKTRIQIINGDDNRLSLLSNIMHNKRVKSRNPYLLNDTMAEDIVKNLNFSSTYELIWGDDNELDSINHQIFIEGIKYLANNYEEYDELIEGCLCKYLPYARMSAEFEFAIPPDKPENEDMGLVRDFSLEYLFFYNSDTLKEQHKNYFSSKTTKKLDQEIEKYIIKVIPKVLKEYAQEINNSGREAFNMISSIIKYETESVNESMMHGPEWFAHQPLTYTEKPWSEVRQKVIDAGENYIKTIIEEQYEIDPFFHETPEAEIGLDYILDD